MESLREAQVLTLLGQYESAIGTLREIAGRYPEIYTARRLLELIALYRAAPSGTEPSDRKGATDG